MAVSASTEIHALVSGKDQCSQARSWRGLADSEKGAATIAGFRDTSCTDFLARMLIAVTGQHRSSASYVA